jgi:type IV secretory pathway TrbD component
VKLVPPIIFFLFGLALWFMPEVGISWRTRPTGRPPRRVLEGAPKQVISVVLMLVSVVTLVFQLNPGYPFVAWLILGAIAFFVAEPPPTPEEEYRRRVEAYDRQQRPLPRPNVLPRKLHAQLTKIAEQGPLKFDTRFDLRYGKKRKAEWEVCHTLFRMRLVSRDWTGPGECIHIFTINDAGKEKLAEMAEDV